MDERTLNNVVKTPSLPEPSIYVSKVTGKEWEIYSGAYYDCHVVSLPQVLPVTLFHAWLTIASMPKIEHGWSGLYCRNSLDSEAARDVILLEQMGVEKYFVSLSEDIESTIQNTISRIGYIICRVDSYYHEHFTASYRQVHSTGHKMTIIDWDEKYYYGIDSVGVKSDVLPIERGEFLDSVFANLYYAYEKPDTLYYLRYGENAQKKVTSGAIDSLVEAKIRIWQHDRNNLYDNMLRFHDSLSDNIEKLSDIRLYSYIRNIYQLALAIEFSYMALLEAFPSVKHNWQSVYQDIDTVETDIALAIKAWRTLKMLCKTAETKPDRVAKQIPIIYKNVIECERKIQLKTKPLGQTAPKDRFGWRIASWLR